MNWNILNKTPFDNNEGVIKILLENRGLKTKKEIEDFLNPKKPIDFTAKDLGIDEKEIKKAIDRINLAIANNEAIVVYGDYDADGICATAILWETLYKLTKNVLPYIPERVSEGYGLNIESIKNLKLKIKNLGLIITVDHGITANEKVKYARELGIDVIVCDHHQLGKEKPKCSAVVHTDKICAAAIAWFLSMSLRGAYQFCHCEESRHGGTTKQSLLVGDCFGAKPLAMTDYLELVTIATIADLEPLVEVNRSFAKYGIEELRKTKRCGLLAIFEEAGLKKEEIDTYHIGYIIAPRLNAMGRMEHALESLRLLCTKDCVKAKSLADKLGLTNKERQLLTEETTRRAVESAKCKVQSAKLIIAGSESYEQGVIGLVAGKLVEEYYRPAIVFSIGETYSKASARSINGFNIIEAIRAQSDLLVDAGGHPMAAGLTIETIKIELLKQRLISEAEKQISDEMLQKTQKVDLELPISSVDLDLWEKTRQLSPFGIANPEPCFCSKAIVKNFRTVGSDGKHLKLKLKEVQNSKFKVQSFSGIGFNLGYMKEKLKIDQEAEIAYNLSLNEWNGVVKVELKIKDIKCKELTN